MDWEILREGKGKEGSFLAASVSRCISCSGGRGCPFDVFVKKVKNASSLMVPVSLMEESGLKFSNFYIHLYVGPVWKAQCTQGEGLVKLVHTSWKTLGEEGLGRLSRERI